MIKQLFKSKSDVVGIDFSNGWIKIAEADIRSGQMCIVNIFAVPFAGDRDARDLSKIPQKEFSRLLWGMLKAKPNDIITCIPRQSVALRFLKLPSSNELEIEKMAEFQASRQLPFSTEDIVTGYRILNIDEDGYSRTALAIAQKNIVNTYFNMLNSAGLMPASICLSTEAILSCFLRSVAQRERPDLGLYLLADIDYLFTELLICEGENILFSRAVAHGAESIFNLDKESEIIDWVRGLTDHIKHSLAAFRKERPGEDKIIRKMFITGGARKFFKYIQDELYREFAVSVECPDIFEDLNITCGEILDIRDKPISVTSAIGMAIDKKALKIDLLPKELKLRRLYKQKRAELMRFYILSVSILVLFFISAGARLYYKQFYINYLDKQLVRLRPQVKQAELVIEKLNVAKNQTDKDAVPLELLKEIYRIIPEDVNLFMFSFTDNKACLLRGTSKTMSRVFEMVSILENSKHFKNVKVAFANKRKIAAEELVDFQINCFLK